MTVEDREVLREVWEGRIPTVFNLAQEDIQVGYPVGRIFSRYAIQ